MDVLQLPLTEIGNRYVVVFQYYLSKWVEAFEVPNKTAETIARSGVQCLSIVEYKQSENFLLSSTDGHVETFN